MSKRTIRARRARFGGQAAARSAASNAQASSIGTGADSAGFEGYVVPPTGRAAEAGSSTAGVDGFATPRPRTTRVRIGRARMEREPITDVEIGPARITARRRPRA